MGLLTNTSSNQGLIARLFTKIVTHAKFLSWVLYLAGVVFIFVMPHSEFSHRTYFSENALLPGLVKVEFDMGKIAKQYLEDLREEAQKTPNAPPFPWIEARLKQMGLEVYRHNFTLNFPLGVENQTYTGDNIYAVLRAQRASSTEALVLATPYRPPLSIETPTDVSVAILLTMAKFFKHQKYWAKDIIFLITQHEQLGMQAWLEAYHRTSCGFGSQVLLHGDLSARAGSIQAAVNLEISHEAFTHINVKVEGLNGQLPNLDLVTLINKLTAKEGLPQMFQGNEDASNPDSWFGYWKSFKTFISMAAKQAAGGVPSGNHGLFHRFGIESVTIESIFKMTKKARRRDFDLRTAGRLLEGIFRSLNNLLERFHQSFFFYLLPSTGRYVSIGMYMPGFGILAGSMLLLALSIWFDCVAAENPPNDEHINPVSKSPEIGGLVRGWLMCHFVLGLPLAFLPRAASVLGTKSFGLSTDDSVAVGIGAFSIAGAFVVFNSRKGSAFGSCWKLVKCVALLEFSMLAFGMSLCNFSLAYVVTLVFAPVAMMATPSKKLISYLIKSVIVILAHPLCIAYLFCLFDTYRAFPEKSILGLLSSSFSAAKQAVMFSITDGYIYGNYTFSVAAVCLMPCWHLVWYIVNANVSTSSSKKAKIE